MPCDGEADSVASTFVARLRARIIDDHMEEVFGEVVVPTEEVVEMRAGKKRKTERKFFPG